MLQEEPAVISVHSTGTRVEHRKSRKEFFTFNILILKETAFAVSFFTYGIDYSGKWLYNYFGMEVLL